MRGTVPRRMRAVNRLEAEPHSTVFQKLDHHAWRCSSQETTITTSRTLLLSLCLFMSMMKTI